MTLNIKFCRACLTSAESFTYILSENVSPKMYWFCTSIEIQEDDLPKTICNNCHELLRKYSDFKMTCLQSQNTLVTWGYGSQNVPELVETKNDELSQEGSQELIEMETDENVYLEIKEEIDTDHCSDVVPEYPEEHLHNDDTSTSVIEESKTFIPKLEAQEIKARKALSKPHTTYTCDICHRKFVYPERFEAHKLEHEGIASGIHCLPCNKTFKSWSSLKRHNENKHIRLSFKDLMCSICGKVCNTQQTLRTHLKAHEEPARFVCEVCGKSCRTKIHLRIHVETHSANRERPFTCEHCGKKFYSERHMLTHVSRRHSGRRFICDLCNFPFTDKGSLVKHLRIHDGKKEECETCKKQFNSYASLVMHRRTHTGDKPFHCKYCPKKFLSKGRLVDHHRVHTGERPHTCVCCGKNFTQRGTLMRHMKVHYKTSTTEGNTSYDDN